MVKHTHEDEEVGSLDNLSMDELVRALEKKYEFHTLKRDIAERMLSAVRPIVRPKVEKVASFIGWTIPQCAKQLILEHGGTLTTRQILDQMTQRGWHTKSARPITVIHSGLSESPYITRIGKRWDLSDRGRVTEF